MNNYPTVNYIGNKEKVADWIIECLPIKNGIVLDLFCGGCSVSYALKKNGFSVISNDALYSNYVLAKAIIENNKEKLNETDYIKIDILQNNVQDKYNEIEFLANRIYYDYEVNELAKLCLISNKLHNYKKYMFLSLLRRAMIRKIPYSRMNIKWEEIQKFRDEEYSYAKYGRYRHYHNIPFIEHINANLQEYNSAIIDGNGVYKALNMDAFDCIKHLKEKVDVIYMDPPYPSTMNKYSEFYGYYDKLFNKTNKIKIDLTDKSEFLNNFKKLVSASIGKCTYLAISLNNKCYPSIDLLRNELKDYIEEYQIFEKEHVYKVTGKGNKHSTYEILLVCKLKEKHNVKEKSD